MLRWEANSSDLGIKMKPPKLLIEPNFSLIWIWEGEEIKDEKRNIVSHRGKRVSCSKFPNQSQIGPQKIESFVMNFSSAILSAAFLQCVNLFCTSP